MPATMLPDDTVSIRPTTPGETSHAVLYDPRLRDLLQEREKSTPLATPRPENGPRDEPFGWD